MVSGNIVKMRMVCSCLLWLLSCVKFCCSETDPGDLKILMDFKNGLDNPELLKWPENGDDPCGPPAWPCVFCSHGRVTQIQVQNLGLKGPLPQNFNQLKKLYNIGLQRNQFRGNLPTFRGLSELEYAFLNFNEFDTIPSDFFEGLNSIRVLALDRNPLNKTDGWSIPIEFENYNQLTNLSLDGCNLVGPIPDFLGNLASLNELILSSNRLSGEVPVTFGQSMMSILWLNDQEGGGLTGSIDVIANMSSLKQAWLHGNSFTGKIPESIGQLSLLKDLNLNGNQLVGMVPQSLADMELDNLDLSNNRLMGPMPEFKAGKFSCESNLFCQSKPGVPCSPEVNALLGFLDGVNYPYFIASQWSGNDPCEGQWLGLNCVKSKVSVISLPRHNLTGSISPSIANLDSLIQINLGGNKLTGSIPGNLTALKSLTLLDVSGNNLIPPLPEFPESVKLVVQGNPLLAAPPGNQTEQPPSSGSTATSPQSPPINPPSGGTKLPPRSAAQPTPGTGSKTSTSGTFQVLRQVKIVKIIIIAGVVALSALIIVLTAVSLHCCFKKRKKTAEAPSSLVVHPRDPSDPGIIKISVSNNTTGSLSTKTAASSTSNISNLTENSHLIESENLVISVQVLRKATKDFAAENQLGSGGFGTVYKGELEDGTKIAAKRMEAGIMSSKALDEFQAEIAVLSRVRHRHLVSLLGFSAEGQERLLVYEYMSQGALSRHLFHWKSLNLEPLSWKRRLSVALDVARGMEYLHSMARKTFIHRDLKSSNILLDDHFHAKVSDFGLVKHAPSGEKSVVTRLAGTFGYLAPEYAVMGKITTKSDVFSYGVVLIELLTGLTALDEERSEERRYLAEWFWRIKSDKEKLRAAIDPALDLNEDTLESCMTTAELAGHCTAREPSHRPDMGHVVNVLGPLVEKWKPILAESEDISGIDYSLPLSQMLKQWQNAENTQQSSSSIGDSRGSIPARPAGFADSFNSADAR